MIVTLSILLTNSVRLVLSRNLLSSKLLDVLLCYITKGDHAAILSVSCHVIERVPSYQIVCQTPNPIRGATPL
jgi:hypothetical protein